MDLRSKLTEEIEIAEWADLLPHFSHGRLLLCGDGFSLLDAAIAIAEDQSGIVRARLDAGTLSRPTDDQAVAWHEAGATFRFLVVQPFVLIKRQKQAEA